MPSGSVRGRHARSNSASMPGLIRRVVIQTKCSSIAASSWPPPNGRRLPGRQPPLLRLLLGITHPGQPRSDGTFPRKRAFPGMSDLRNSIEYMNDIVIPSITSSEMGRLEARICELAGHLTAASCQFLLLVAEFDARRGWADWEMSSCAAWLSWRCQLAPGTAREQVRVARALGGFPLITAEFAAGRLSYAKVRALTRIASPETEADLLQMAIPMTASQIERFARAHRRVSGTTDSRARPAHK